jgi:NADH-quinone oxidoreductase subunit L
MPYTHWTFLVGSLSLAGIVPFAGFFSKDEILVALKLASESAEKTMGEGYGQVYTIVQIVAIFTAFLTAFYTFRAYFLTFWGPEKLPSPTDPEAEPEEALHAHGPVAAHSHEVDPHRPLSEPPPTPGATDEPVPQTAGHGHGHGGHDDHFGHESPPVMWVPLVILSACVLIVGWFGPLGWFEGLLGRTPSWIALKNLEHAHGFDFAVAGLGLLAGVLGIGLAWLMYFKPSTAPETLSKFAGGRPYSWSLHKFFVDELYQAVVVKPLEVLAKVSAFLDEYLVHGLLVQGFAWIPRVVGRDLLAPFQNGLIQFYAGASALGVTVLLLYLLWT